MRKIFTVFTIVLVLITGIAQGQGKIPYDLEFNEILEHAWEAISLDSCLSMYYDSTVTTRAFDFFDLKPSNEGDSSCYFQLGYKNKGLRKISFINENNHLGNYSLYLFPSEDFTFGVAYISDFENVNDDKTYLVKGLFVRINSTGYSFFCGMRSDMIANKLTSEEIVSLMSIDRYLSATSKINIYRNEPLTFSRFVLKEEELWEKLKVIPKTHSIFGNKPLANYTLFELIDLLEGDGFMTEVSALVKPVYPIKGKQIWSYPFNKYLTEP